MRSSRFAPRSRLAASLLPLALAATASAARWQVDLDPQRTQINFTLKATMHTVEGTAALTTGSLLIDPLTGRAEGDIVVDATSVNTANGSRDKKMHNKVLLSETYPVIRFRIHHMEGTITAPGRTEVVLVGQLELLGRLHEVRVPAGVEVDGDRFTAEARFEVPYVEWGLEDPSTFLLRVAKQIPVTVETEGSIARTEALP